MALQETLRTAAFAASLLVLAGCSGGGHHHHGGTGSGVAHYYEAEPNGHPSNANFVRSVSIGDYFVINGQVSSFHNDWFDGFWMWATEDVDVEFILTYNDPFADLDVGWYDPAGGGYVQRWETSYNPEIGLLPLYANEDFHLVVTPWTGTSTYTLEIIGHPLGYAASQAPAAVATELASNERLREVPFERYHTPESAPEQEQEPEIVARGRVIELDPEDGSVRSRAVEVTSTGLRIGPPRSRAER